MSLLSKLFGTKSGPAAAEPVTHEGFRIFAEPQPDGGKFRIAARIEKDFGEETRTHQLIRADMLDDRDSAVEATLRKARQVIDEQGDRLFG